MRSPYEILGFKHPDYMENPYGIRIYVGHIGQKDWCVLIPKELCKSKYSTFTYDKDVVFYLISESEALWIAEEYTEIAKKMKG